jgi:alkanesulfonate monooxygenase SsuD/methylene tetrahydromethanopterin reductase-like flavin-dependent oxidoreductase (luciferase family)
VDLGRRENLTVRHLIGRLGGGRGHRTFAGTPEQVAATLEHWFTHGAGASHFGPAVAAVAAGVP